MILSSTIVGILLVAALGLAADPAIDTGEKPADARLHEKWKEVYREIAQSLEMRHGETRLELRDVPLLHYSNPVRTIGQHGSLFLWTEGGRPAVLGSVWSAVDRQRADVRNITHEFHSLVEDSEIHSSIDGETTWTSGEPGVVWQKLEGTPGPAKSRPARLVQMRELARRLTASITTEEQKGELRLMPQPLYRYPENVAGEVDGALFVFALATDPELVLLVEQSPDADETAWRVAFARFGNLGMEVRDGDRSLWTCERGVRGRSAGKYYLRWRIEQRPADLAAEASTTEKQD